MKKLAFLITLFLVSHAVYSQYSLDLGLKAGFNSSKLTTDRSQYNPETINNFHFGAFGRININRIYIQPEAYYISKGGDIKDVLDPNPLQTISSFNYDMVDVPVLIGGKILDGEAFNFRAMAGPVFSFVTKKEVDGQSSPFSPNDLKDNFMGYQLGIGIDFLLLTFDVRMERSSSNVFTGADLNSKSNTFLFTLGAKIL